MNVLSKVPPVDIRHRDLIENEGRKSYPMIFQVPLYFLISFIFLTETIFL